jgi:hypothetical protein
VFARSRTLRRNIPPSHDGGSVLQRIAFGECCVAEYSGIAQERRKIQRIALGGWESREPRHSNGEGTNTFSALRRLAGCVICDGAKERKHITEGHGRWARTSA